MQLSNNDGKFQQLNDHRFVRVNDESLASLQQSTNGRCVCERYAEKKFIAIEWWDENGKGGENNYFSYLTAILAIKSIALSSRVAGRVFK